METEKDIISSLFGGPARVAVLRVLAGTTDLLTGRQVARAAGLSHSGANRALDHLASIGVVRRRAVGPSVVNELAREHELVSGVLTPAIDAERRIARARGRATDDVPGEIVKRLVEGFDPVRIILFGSRARGEADSRSDFDLLVVLPEVADKHAVMVAMLVALGDFAVPVDIVTADAGEVVGAPVPGSVLERALTEGKVIYERVA